MTDRAQDIAQSAIELSGVFAWQQEHTSRKTVQLCGRVPISSNVHLFVTETANGTSVSRKVFASGLRRCNSANVCASCSTRIGRKRRRVLERIFANAIERGYEVAMLTFTIRHERDGLALESLLGAMSAAYKNVHNSQAFNELRKQYQAQILRVTEVTDGPNGWHPHFHVAIVHRPGFNWDVERPGLIELWANNVEAMGLPRPDDLQDGDACKHRTCPGGVHVNRSLHVRSRCGSDELAQYVTKACGALGATAASLEIAGSRYKDGRGDNISVWQLLALAAEGNARAAARWAEYEREVKRARFWAPSKGFAAQFGEAWEPEDDQAEIDPELVEVDPETGALSVTSADNQQNVTWLGTFQAHTWRQIRKHGLLREVIDAASDGGALAVNQLLRRNRLWGFFIRPTLHLAWQIDAQGEILNEWPETEEAHPLYEPHWFSFVNDQASARSLLLRMAA